VYAESYYPRDSSGWHELRGLLNARFAYIDAPRPELYDLRHDPEECHNLASANASLAASLREKLEEVERRYAGRALATSTTPDPETMERLRSLGYVSFESSLPTQNDPRRADPKDKIETLQRILRASDLRASVPSGRRRVGTDSVSPGSRLSSDNQTTLGLQAETPRRCQRPTWVGRG
jgi:hypothetical protein